MLEKVITRVNVVDDTWDTKEWLDKGRRWWKANAGRVIECDQLFVLDSENVVKAVGKIAGVMKDLDSGSGRISIEVQEDPEVGRKWIGREIKRCSSRNPLVYVSEIEEA